MIALGRLHGRVAFLSLPIPVRLKGVKPIPLADLGDDLPAQLRRRRRELGIHQVEAARQLGVCEFTLGNWEAGDNQPVDRYYPAIIRYLGYEPWPVPERLGEALVAERRRRGLTGRDAAAVMGVDPGTLGRWERGAWKPTKRTLGGLSNFLGIDVGHAFPADLRCSGA